MDRRQFLATSSVASCGLAFTGSTIASAESTKVMQRAGAFSLDDNLLRFTHPGVTEAWNMVMLADTHLFREDERDADFRQYSARMARAYNVTAHFQTKEATNPEACFQQTLRLSQEHDARIVALVGDIVSFPSQAAVEWVAQQLRDTATSYLYVAGNHDWHYEGMNGSLEQLRSTWIHERLMPLYDNSAMGPADSPLMMSSSINGVRIVALDNSNYQITDAQLAYFRDQAASGQPLLLLVHIPLYAPHRSMGFGCGHPEWGAATDKNFELERRERWPEAGHTSATMEFHKTVFSTPNLLGVLAGHIHRPSVDVVHGIPQVVTGHNATGAYLRVEFHPV
jgi:predicted phosphodiesterase